MVYAYNQVIGLYSIAIAVILLFYSRRTADRQDLPYRLYVQMLIVTVVLLCGDLLCGFDGRPGATAMWANATGNFILFLLNITVPSFYLVYVDQQIHHDARRTRRLAKPLLLLHALNTALLGISLFTGWLYSIDGQNRYHRGPLFPLPLLVFFLLTAAAFFLVVTNRRHIERKSFAALALFPVPPIVCIVLQLAFYGMSLMLHGLILSQLVIFLSIQNRSLHTDYLTGAYNRKKLEAFLRDKVTEVTDARTFSAIMIDLDNFKEINDRQGHDIGDRALEEATRLLKRCLRADDLVARYGGDEFYVVLDIPGQEALEGAVARIRTALGDFNRQNQHPFRLSFSMGYDLFDPARHQSAEGFQKALDQLMYQDKERKRLGRERPD
mgnify:CR=1 FL=1